MANGAKSAGGAGRAGYLPTETIVQRLSALGGREWQKGNYHRVYFNFTDDLLERLGLKVWRYKSGNVSGATYKGESISNSQAKATIGLLLDQKVFYDLKTRTFNVQTWGFYRPTGRSAEMIAELERLVQEALRGRRKRA